MKILVADHVLPISSEPVENGAIAIEADKIVLVGKSSEVIEKFPGSQIENFGESVLMPGLVNCHTHLELTAMRGYLDDLDRDFLSWLITLTKIRADKLTEEDINLSAVFGALEAVRAGVTCVGDIGRLGNAGFEALKINGLRGIAFQETEFSPNNTAAGEDLDALLKKFQSLRETETKLVKAGISPHSPYTVSRRLFEAIVDFALEKGVKITIHAAESAAEAEFLKKGTGVFAEIYNKFGVSWQAPGMSPVEYLSEIGVLRIKPLLAHCVKVSERDIELIQASDSGIAHCPKSNAKFGHGIAPFEKFLSNEINVGFGSDSMASNNTCDIFEEARFGALMARTRDGAGEFASAGEIIKTATLGGAIALGLGSQIGSLEIGKEADIIAVSLDYNAQLPVHDLYSALLFATNARDVKMTMVAGEEIYRDGIVKKVDEADLKRKMKSFARKFRGD